MQSHGDLTDRTATQYSHWPIPLYRSRLGSPTLSSLRLSQQRGRQRYPVQSAEFGAYSATLPRVLRKERTDLYLVDAERRQILPTLRGRG